MSQVSTPKLIGNGAAVIAVVLGGAIAIDRLAAWLGYQSGLFCHVLMPLAALTETATVILVIISLVMLVMSGFKQGFGLLIGGLILSALPGVVLQYLGAGGCPA